MTEYLKNLTEKIDQALLDGIDEESGVLVSSIHYSLSLKGKRLRPLLFLSLIEASGKDPLKYMDIAVAIEYIHTYSLIHDDLPAMDDDDFRRGMPTVHKKFNEAVALLAGDTLLTMAVERISNTDISSEIIVNILKILTKSIGIEGMAGGQSLDLLFDGDENKIIEIHRKKTAELIKGAILSAAEISEFSKKEKKILEYIGIKIGIAFQMADDLLDIEGNEKEVGKKLKKDISNKSPNSVIYFGRDFIKNEIESSFNEIMNLLKEINIQFPPFSDLLKRMVYRSK
ncbi:MAG: polyprenyl synthetase family protein [Acidobacteriota bacterium]